VVRVRRPLITQLDINEHSKRRFVISVLIRLLLNPYERNLDLRLSIAFLLANTFECEDNIGCPGSDGDYPERKPFEIKA
jgi:hypothetical protein